jgi:hypothetical protein
LSHNPDRPFAVDSNQLPPDALLAEMLRTIVLGCTIDRTDVNVIT